MPKFARTFGERGQDFEIDQLWKALDALQQAPAQAAAATTVTTTPPVLSSVQVAKASDLTTGIPVGLIEVDDASALTLTSDNGAAKVGWLLPVLETPSGTINSSNTVFTLAHTPLANALFLLFLDGKFQRPGGGNDYTLSGTTITFAVAPTTGSHLIVLYQHP